jgi:hypothetical protein
MQSEVVAQLALQILPAPILTVGVLGAFGILTWKRGLGLTACTAIVATWLRLRFADFAMACLGAGCNGNWMLQGYLFIYGMAVVGGLVVALVLIPLALRLRPKGTGAAPA